MAVSVEARPYRPDWKRGRVAGWERRQYDALFDYLDAELGGGGGDGS